MLTIIGLALDLIGAAALAVGLFRAPTPDVPSDWLYSPDDVASDRAYGTIGGTFLAVGFTLQGLAAFDVQWDGGTGTKLGVLATTLVAGGAAAFGGYRAARRGLPPPAERAVRLGPPEATARRATGRPRPQTTKAERWARP